MNLATNHNGIPFRQIDIQPALNQIKADIENAITTGGEKEKNALIKSQAPIKLIHDVVKTMFYNNGNGVHESLINPELRRLRRVITPNRRQTTSPITLRDKELCLSGYLKTKNQDVSIIPRNIPISPEILQYPTYLNGFVDAYGTTFTESVLSVNVRSQLSSAAKNFDTLYERTFAEALNLHLRVPQMVLGEVYMIIVREYDSDLAAENTVGFKDSEHVEKYILAFQALNNRLNHNDPLYKYERIALLIVDFSQQVPKIYNTTQELIQDNLIPQNSNATMQNLSFNNFAQDLMQIYTNRFPANRFR